MSLEIERRNKKRRNKMSKTNVELIKKVLCAMTEKERDSILLEVRDSVLLEANEKIKQQKKKNNKKYGEKRYCLNGELHRINGPAVICVNGDKEWYLNGKKHRIDGPAVKYANGDKY